MNLKHFFNAISLDSVSVLVRHLSNNPCSERWLKTVNASDVLTLLQFGGALTVAARQQFKTMDRDDYLNETVCEGDFIFNTVKLPAELNSVLNIMAPYLERLYFHNSFTRFINWDQIRFCVLRVLICDNRLEQDDMKRIIVLAGASLRELHISSNLLEGQTIRTIAQHCVSLEVLNLSGVTWFGESLEMIWRAIGRTLREIGGSVHEREHVHITRHCKRLEKLKLSLTEELLSSSSTYELLRAQQTLQVLTIEVFAEESQLASEKLRALLAVCPSNLHVHCEMELDSIQEFMFYAQVIGIRLRVLYLSLSTWDILPRELSCILVNLESLTLPPILENSEKYLDVIKSIFAEPMPNLRHLDVGYLDGPEMLNILARCTTCLVEFSCELAWHADNELELLPVKASELADFLHINKQLCHIRVGCLPVSDERYDEGRELQEVFTVNVQETANLIRSLKFCSQLREIQIDAEFTTHFANVTAIDEKIRTACVPLRTRRVSVVVNRTHYLPFRADGRLGSNS